MKKNFFLLSIVLIMTAAGCEFISSSLDIDTKTTKSLNEERDHCAVNIEEQFINIPFRGKSFTVKNKNFFGDFEYTNHPFNKMGNENHFQGINRLANNGFILTGSNKKNMSSDLFSIKKYSVIHRKNLMGIEWHIGDIDVEGNLVAVPLEENSGANLISKIYIYDYSNLQSPELIGDIIERPTKKGGSVIFHRLASGQYLLGVYDQSTIDFYLSKTMNINDGWVGSGSIIYSLRSDEISGFSSDDFFFRAGMTLIRQCDEQLYIIAFKNTSKINPIIRGEDSAYLFKLNIDFSGDSFANDLSASLSYIGKSHQYCGTKCNFDAAVSAFIDENGSLIYYSTPFWRNVNMLGFRWSRFIEYDLYITEFMN